MSSVTSQINNSTNMVSNNQNGISSSQEAGQARTHVVNEILNVKSFPVSDADSADFEKAYRLAVKRLAKKEECTKGVELFLENKKVPANIISKVVGRLKDLALLDDVRFAHCLIRTHAKQFKGKRLIAMVLRQKGVEMGEFEIQRVLEETWEKSEPEWVMEWVNKRFTKWQEDAKIRKRAQQALQRRGFTYVLP